ncbi:(5-formylfuran-3-yl)methyl phosphate synthase [Methyloligella sp. 2.7D]|uniref:(5-formylfuran-3-yl)methyl phosphate synthase n=1 Tax=unclassified Methyloligella TaxID=2625955 RepID=UPI00157D7235|nr:(5-formylfuran-3-yl)methyl phosphate synthase [Methyloligella sp. GL2]QKP77786.1 hypothetical protein HT051_10230 [Methyloligella sp. GL2]
MTKFLASVRNADEAETALQAGADIIDLKEPDGGALGAVSPKTAAVVVAQIGGRAKVSATIGDLPMVPESVQAAIETTAKTGADYVKFGVFPGPGAEACLGALVPPAGGAGLVAVLFADDLPKFEYLPILKNIGVAGVMLDTRRKGHGSLLDHLHLASLRRFVETVQQEGVMAGLAGSLKPHHLQYLLPLQPDLLGFRGALCDGETRNNAMDAARCAKIRALIPQEVRQEPLTQSPLPDGGAAPIC